MKVTITVIDDITQFQNKYGEQSSWWMQATDDAGTVHRIKINSKTFTYKVGQTHDVERAGDSPWENGGKEYWPVKKVQNETYASQDASLPPVPENPPHPADEIPGYRPPAAHPASAGGTDSDLALERDLDKWLVLLREKREQAGLDYSDDAVLESARTIAVHKAISRERRG